MSQELIDNSGRRRLNADVSYRTKLAIVIFTVGLIPSLFVIGVSTFLLTSSINRIAASGLETSLSAAERLVENSQMVIGSHLRQLLRSRHPLADSLVARAWLLQNGLDLVYEISDRRSMIAFSDSIQVDSSELNERIPSKPGLLILSFGSYEILAFSEGDSIAKRGCGILLPEGYGRQGKALSKALSISASLGIIKSFSSRILIIVAGMAVLLSITMSIVISGFLSKRLTNPLAELSRGAEIIGGGELNHQVMIAGHDEFARLGESFNKMASEIRENQRMLLEAERLAAWREVAQRIAHEIRNPLTPMAVQIYRLQKELGNLPTPSRGLEALEAIKKQLEILQNLAGQFSTFAKEPELKPVKCSLENIIDNAINSGDFGTGLKITRRVTGSIPNLELDPQMMVRAISNLLKNSQEAQPAGGAVDINIKRTNDGIELILRDSGPGFPAEKLTHIDQPYITSKPTGTGLGLAIVKKIIEEHGGSIKFYNDNGAICKINLPIS